MLSLLLQAAIVSLLLIATTTTTSTTDAPLLHHDIAWDMDLLTLRTARTLTYISAHLIASFFLSYHLDFARSGLSHSVLHTLLLVVKYLLSPMYPLFGISFNCLAKVD
jgi:hypothetical protein